MSANQSMGSSEDRKQPFLSTDKQETSEAKLAHLLGQLLAGRWVEQHAHSTQKNNDDR